MNNFRTTIATLIAVAALGSLSACAVSRGQETVGAYVDDTSITSQVKGRFVGNKQVDASSISVETLKGVVMLAGFAKNDAERTTAESIASSVKGVKSVTNHIVVKP